MLFLSEVLSTVLQVVAFSLIPLIWWLCTARKKEGFLSWVGLKKPAPEDWKKWAFAMVATYVVLFAVGQLAVLLRGELEVESEYAGMGAAALPCILVYSFGHTALSEEILFRGFLLKRLAARFGFSWANLIQAAVFGLIHLVEVLLLMDIGFVAGFVIVVYPMLTAMLMSYVNEKMSGGSILPSWLIHGCLNFLELLLLAFQI
ncbi:MAG: CPBP family intramembrane metalloprotease [Clostridiales bacterium]|nr:CPBP family intramembrane metalloprotease [Clostridiales bacterium]